MKVWQGEQQAAVFKIFTKFMYLSIFFKWA